MSRYKDLYNKIKESNKKIIEEQKKLAIMEEELSQLCIDQEISSWPTWKQKSLGSIFGLSMDKFNTPKD